MCVARAEMPQNPAAEIAKLEALYVMLDEVRIDWDVMMPFRRELARRIVDKRLLRG